MILKKGLRTQRTVENSCQFTQKQLSVYTETALSSHEHLSVTQAVFFATVVVPVKDSKGVVLVPMRSEPTRSLYMNSCTVVMPIDDWNHC